MLSKNFKTKRPMSANNPAVALSKWEFINIRGDSQKVNQTEFLVLFTIQICLLMNWGDLWKRKCRWYWHFTSLSTWIVNIKRFFLDLLRIYLLKYDTVNSLSRNNQFLQYFLIWFSIIDHYNILLVISRCSEFLKVFVTFNYDSSKQLIADKMYLTMDKVIRPITHSSDHMLCSGE